jgi:hypothetical protein
MHGVWNILKCEMKFIGFHCTVAFVQHLHSELLMYCLIGLMAATLAPPVRISVTGGQEGSDLGVNEEKGLRIKNRQPSAAVTDGKFC